MRKRGARIRHQAKAVPGLIAQNLGPEYETRLRMAVEAFRGGWAQAAHFNDLADTLDLLQIGIALYPAQKADPGASAAAELALMAMQNVRERFETRSKMGVTGEELKALELLAEVSIDYWNRRSGALFAEAYRQLVKVRSAQRDGERKAA
ncbi:MAG TPA: hypothetical protein PLN31_17230 [Azoarcus taiwanensis]|nr:hypothetical protein [Azoarcus taiwanensis]